MSAAVVSGAVALLLESTPELTPQQVKISLQSAASPIDGRRFSRSGCGKFERCVGNLRGASGADSGAAGRFRLKGKLRMSVG